MIAQPFGSGMIRRVATRGSFEHRRVIEAVVPFAQAARHSIEATRILSQFSEVNPISRGDEYRQAGWQRFDEAGEPYLPLDHFPRRDPPL